MWETIYSVRLGKELQMSKGGNKLMKAITIIQPWATLIALGEKKFESRSWATKYRGPLAIHAGKKIEKEICKQEPFKSVLAKHGYTAESLPVSVVVAIGNLTACYEVGQVDISQKEADLRWTDRIIRWQEFDFGWYEYGRFAWELLDVKALDQPIPAKGQLGLWNYEEIPL
jgi:hypothetical protein